MGSGGCPTPWTGGSNQESPQSYASASLESVIQCKGERGEREKETEEGFFWRRCSSSTTILGGGDAGHVSGGEEPLFPLKKITALAH